MYVTVIPPGHHFGDFLKKMFFSSNKIKLCSPGSFWYLDIKIEFFGPWITPKSKWDPLLQATKAVLDLKNWLLWVNIIFKSNKMHYLIKFCLLRLLAAIRKAYKRIFCIKNAFVAWSNGSHLLFSVIYGPKNSIFISIYQ